MNEVLVAVMGTIGTGAIAGFGVWSKRQMELPKRVDRLETKTDYLVTKVDKIYDHLIERADRG